MRKIFLICSLFVMLLDAKTAFAGFFDTFDSNAWSQGLFGGSNSFDFSEYIDLLTEPLPETCDPDFWEVIKSRAWQEGQREVTQGTNLMAKPDSVLKYTCFSRYLNHFAKESTGNYPADPNYSFEESFLELGQFAFRTARDIYNAPLTLGNMIGFYDPFFKNNMGSSIWNLYIKAALEVLILDTMVSDVSYAQTLPAYGTIDDLAAVLCNRNFYIEKSESAFDYKLLGNRNTTVTNYIPDNRIDLSDYSCDIMDRIWHEAKCYNANTEESHDDYYPLSSLGIDAAVDAPRTNMLRSNYLTNDGKYRTQVMECSDNGNLWSVFNSSGGNVPNFGNVVCDLYFNGIPAIPVALYWPWSGTPPLTWSDAHTTANPAPGDVGAIEPYKTLKDLYDPSKCTSYKPIKTGVVIQKANTSSATPYDDAYCIAPGCRYDPSVSTTECQPY